MMPMSPEASNIGFLIGNFAERVPGVNEAIVVSADGLLMSMSRVSPASPPTASPRPPAA